MIKASSGLFFKKIFETDGQALLNIITMKHIITWRFLCIGHYCLRRGYNGNNPSRSIGNARCKNQHVGFHWLVDLSTLDSMRAPCSVNTYGAYRRPPKLEVPKWILKFKASYWHLKESHPSGESWNMNSSGKRPILRLKATVH